MAQNLLFPAQSVRVEAVESLCYAKKYYPGRKRSSSIPEGTPPTSDCQGVKRLIEDRARRGIRDLLFMRGTFASFRYVSPADGRVHTGRINRDRNDQKRPIRVGDMIVIHASRWDTGAYTDFSSPTWP